MSFQSPTLKQWWCFCIALVFFGCVGDWWDGSSAANKLGALRVHNALYLAANPCLKLTACTGFTALVKWPSHTTDVWQLQNYLKTTVLFLEAWLELRDWVGMAEPLPRQRLPGSTMGADPCLAPTWASSWPWSSPAAGWTQPISIWACDPHLGHENWQPHSGFLPVSWEQLLDNYSLSSAE